MNKQKKINESENWAKFLMISESQTPLPQHLDKSFGLGIVFEVSDNCASTHFMLT